MTKQLIAREILDMIGDPFGISAKPLRVITNEVTLEVDARCDRKLHERVMEKQHCKQKPTNYDEHERKS